MLSEPWTCGPGIGITYKMKAHPYATQNVNYSIIAPCSILIVQIQANMLLGRLLTPPAAASSGAPALLTTRGLERSVEQTPSALSRLLGTRFQFR